MHGNNDTYLTLTEAADRAPGRPTTNCVWRWCRQGVLARNRQRIYLRHVRIGSQLFTTRAWLDEFGQRLAVADAEHFAPSPARNLTKVKATRSYAERQAAIERAERSLARAGL